MGGAWLRTARFGPPAVLAVLSVTAAAHARSGPADRCIDHEVVHAGPNLVSGPKGELLAWSQDGKGRIRDQKGHWSADLNLGASDIKAVVPDPDGFLLVRRGPGVNVLLLGPGGATRETWRVDFGNSEVALASHPGGRWLLTNRALIPLYPGSVVAPRQPLPQSFVSRVNPDASFPPPAPPPAFLQSGNQSLLLCLPSSPYAEGWGKGLCERTGPGGWHVEHPLEGPAALCGNWIVQTGENVVTARSAQTGKPTATKHVDVAGQMTCVGSDRVAVGGKTVSILTLPSLNVAHHVKLQHGRVASMAYTGDAIAVTTDEGSGIDWISGACARGGPGSRREESSP
jgi:hypothetical protein